MAAKGILMAVLALISWTVSDYSIEQSTRKVGNWQTLFFIGLFNFIFITPFIFRDLIKIFETPSILYPLLIFSVVTLISAILMFQGLKLGKFSVIEPVFGLELPAAIFFSIIVGGEHLSILIYSLCFVVFFGLMLAVATRETGQNIGRMVFEKGVIFAAAGALGMGLMDFLTGHFSRELSPLIAVWFLHGFVGILCFLYLLAKGEVKNSFKNIKKYLRPTLGVGIFDNTAWIAYAYSMIYLPISVATTIAESYIAFGVLIGIFINKEKVQRHQIAGIALAIIGVLALSYLFVG